MTLLEREVYAYRKAVGYKVPKKPVDGVWTDAQEEERQKEQALIDTAEPLSDKEKVWLFAYECASECVQE